MCPLLINSHAFVRSTVQSESENSCQGTNSTPQTNLSWFSGRHLSRESTDTRKKKVIKNGYTLARRTVKPAPAKRSSLLIRKCWMAIFDLHGAFSSNILIDELAIGKLRVALRCIYNFTELVSFGSKNITDPLDKSCQPIQPPKQH